MTCTSGKIPYASAAEAWRAAEAIGRRHVRRSGPRPQIKVLVCPDCGAWHLGGSLPSQSARRHARRGS